MRTCNKVATVKEAKQWGSWALERKGEAQIHFLSFFLCFCISKKIMGSINLVLSSTLLLLLVGFATSDINQDKSECMDKIIGLAGCLTYVSGEAAVPTMDCCSGLKEVIDKSKRCLCILIKDRNDPSLGLKVNVTLALKLPEVCKTPTNITECVGEFLDFFLCAHVI